MPFGILEDTHFGEHGVPGTALLSEELGNEVGKEIKRANGYARRFYVLTMCLSARSLDGRLILVPQPSDDGWDPLNWPKWKKEALFWSLCLAAGLASGSIGHLLNVGFKEIASEWGVSVDTVAQTNADLAMALGWFTLVQGSLAIKMGRRPMFLFASACQFFTCIWSARSTNINSFRASRVFQGFGMAPYEALVTASIGDVFFVHERGFRVAVWNFAIGAGIAVTPIINGFIIQQPDLGWRWTFWIIMVMFGISFISSVFLMPETMYDRQPNTCRGDVATAQRTPSEILVGCDESSKKEQGIVQFTKTEVVEENTSVSERMEAKNKVYTLTRPPKTFWQELAPWSYTNREISFWKSLLRPFSFGFSPAVWFSFFAYGLTTVWLVVLSVIYSVVFGGPPYFFDATTVGFVSIGPFIGSVIGTLIAGPLSDYSVKFAARKNHGVYEPEFRLFLLVPMFILDVVGYIGWAVMQPLGLPWIGPVVMYSMISAGQCLGSTAVCSYLIDVHRKNAPECFALINFLKNMVLYGFTLFVNGWVIRMGITPMFGVLTALTAFCILTGIPMYIFGKRTRSFVARHPRIFLS